MKMAALMDEQLKMPDIHITTFLFHSIVITQNEFSSFVNGITFKDTEFKTDQKLDQEELSESLFETLDEIISISKREKTVENFARLKYNLDYFFLNLTEKGHLIYNYNEDYLLRSQIVAAELKVSKPTLLTYVEKGLEYLTEHKGQKKIPRHVIFYWSSPAWATKIMLLFQDYKRREMTLQDKYNEILAEIEAYESKYEGTFEEVFSNVLSGEVDGDDLDNAEDYFDWCDLREEAEAYDQLLRGYDECL